MDRIYMTLVASFATSLILFIFSPDSSYAEELLKGALVMEVVVGFVTIMIDIWS